MGKIIIGIHGLGNKPPEQLLKKWWSLSMIEGLQLNNFKAVLPDFEMVYWADIIYEKPLDESEEDENSPRFIEERYTKTPDYFPVESHERRKKLVDFMLRQMDRIFLNEDLSLNYSFISDTIIKKYFKDLEIYYSENSLDEKGNLRMAHDLIRERLLRKLEEHRNDDIMLIAHSMGSIIGFDVLTFLANDIKINTFITIGSPLGLPVVISKIASEQKKHGRMAYNMMAPPGITKNWSNFSDILDKVAFDYKLSDSFASNNNGIKPVDFLVVNNYVMNGIHNPHKSFGYLRTPEFSKILNDFIVSGKLTIKQKVLRKIGQFIEIIKKHLIFGNINETNT
jgi:hypothetical protein